MKPKAQCPKCLCLLLSSGACARCTDDPRGTHVGDILALGALQSERFALVLDSQELAAIGIAFATDDISGALVEIVDGDYGEVWVTGYSRPFDLASSYTRVN